MKMPRTEYIEAINMLKEEVLKMGELSKRAVYGGVQSLIGKDFDLASKIVREDNNRIDILELEIEEKCMDLIALQQPVAKDLRIIGTCMKIITDLDRLSNLGVNIAKITIKIGDKPFIKPLIDIPRMGKLATEMLDDAMKAFMNEDVELARGLSKKEEEADALYDQVRRELITFMVEDPHTITIASDLSFIARYLKRIADHACNIAARVIYMVTGEREKVG